MKNIPFVIKIAAKPILILVLFLSLSLFGFSKAFSEIKSLRGEIAKTRKSDNILKSKLDVLSLNQTSAQTEAGSVSSYLPGENPALLVLYKLKSNAVISRLFMENIKVGSETKDASGFMKISISFDISGPLDQILNFINLTKKTAPNVWVNKTELNFQEDILKASISTNSYWAPFPTKIPALTEPIASLDASEKEIVSSLGTFGRTNIMDVQPEAPRVNSNPFGE